MRKEIQNRDEAKSRLSRQSKLRAAERALFKSY